MGEQNNICEEKKTPGTRVNKTIFVENTTKNIGFSGIRTDVNSTESERDYQVDYAEFQTSLLELRNAGIKNTESPRVPRYQVPGTPVPGTPGYLVQVQGTRYLGTRYPGPPGTGYRVHG